jgi:hypothetical protein
MCPPCVELRKDNERLMRLALEKRAAARAQQ